MTLRQYLTIMLLATIFCWIAWWFVISNVDPFQGDGLGFFFFYLSLFLAILGTLSLLTFVVRKILSSQNLQMFRYVQKSFRDAIFIALLVVLLLFLQAQGYLHWWNLGIFAVGLLLLLALVFTTKKQQTTDSLLNQ